MATNLKGKKVLITAGPTWVPLDKVRVISNTASGETGMILARKLQKLGAKVTLLLGPSGSFRLSRKIRLVGFKFFRDLQKLLKKELRTAKYDIVIHSAAVSDYRPKNAYAFKVGSGKKSWRVDLVPTPKIISEIKKISPGLFLVGFKFESKASLKEVVKKARALIRESGADLVVANTSEDDRYNACLVSRGQNSRPFGSKKELAGNLIKKIGEEICQN